MPQNSKGPPPDKFPYDNLPEQALESLPPEILDQAPEDTAAALSGYTALYGWEPWLFDGANAFMIDDIYAGPESSTPYFFTVVGEDLVFAAMNEQGWAIYDLDGPTGSLSSTHLGGSAPRGVTDSGGLVYFTAHNGVDGYNLFSYDSELDSLDVVSPSWSDTSWITNAGGYVYYVADDGTSGLEVVRYDPITGANDMFDLSTEATPGFQGWLTGVGDDLYFRGHDGETTGLFKIEAGADQAVEVDLTLDGVALYDPQTLTAVGNDLFFQANSAEYGRELVRLDGATGALTQWDVVEGQGSSNPLFMTEFGDSVYFVAADDGSFARRLYSIDAEDNLNALTTADGAFPDRPYSFAAYDGDLYFTAYTPETGGELWKVESDTGNLELAYEFIEGPESESILPVGEVGGVLALGVYDAEAVAYKLATYDGSGITYNDDVEQFNPSTFTLVDGGLFLA